MDKQIAKPWYVGVTHVLTSYIAAGFLTFILIFIIASIALLLRVDSENVRVYIAFMASMVFIPLLLFPATLYSIKFIMNRYVISETESIIRFALISIAALKVVIDVLSFSSFSMASIISFLLSLAVFYSVSVKTLEVNEGKDSFNIKDVVMKS